MQRFLCILFLAFASSVHAEDLNVLFLGDSGHHQPKARFDELQPVLADHGVQLVYTDQLADITLENLRQYDVLAVYANIDEIDDAGAQAILDYVDQGGGFVPLHCATYCFRNQPELVALMGAQFLRHGTGVFQAEIDKPAHELMKGYGGFRAWDETYVHTKHNDIDRIVLEYRADQEGREPWTWVRTHGRGRVFYTASGHDSRTWTHRGFQNLVERGIRWAAGKDPSQAGKYLDELAFPVPQMKPMSPDRAPFQYKDVGAKIPNYTPSKTWGVQGKPKNEMQLPLDPLESMKHLVVPTGFHVELFVAEPDLKGKPICMTWDERGRLWVAETYDYPNELNPPGGGRDRIRICEDTDGDGRADKFTVFADKLSIPTSIVLHRGGAIVQNALETLYLKDTDGDDQADVRKVLVKGWSLGDTHGGVSNFQYGLDNWIWAMQGYNRSAPVADGQAQQTFRMGFFRMRPDGSEVEFIRSTNNNTWGLGISEEGLIFGSTANGNPSIYMPIPNRYYERVRGWATSLTLSSIADTNDFQPITENVRQVDHHGGYTAAAGHALYTAREYPQEYWNRVAFVNGPTGHLVGSFVLNKSGTDYSSSSPFNLMASDDEWTAPIMSEVGPDGQVWVIDWYNYIVQHNPTPEGFKTGKGAAYETELRDKKHGRIYRVVADRSTAKPTPDLGSASPAQLVEFLAHPTMLIRKHAQRLLVERGEIDVVEPIIQLIETKTTDEIGLNVGAIHALWTLHGLGLLDGNHRDATQAVYSGLLHPSAGVRRNAIAVLPPTSASVDALVAANLHQDDDYQVRLAATLAFADLPPHANSARALSEMFAQPANLSDRWMPDALTSAAAHNSGMVLTEIADSGELPEACLPILARVADHHIRGDENNNAPELLAGLNQTNPQVAAAIVEGFNRGWKPGHSVTLTPAIESRLAETLERVDVGTKSTLVKLAISWGSENLSKYAEEIRDRLMAVVKNEDAMDADRIQSAQQLIEFQPDNQNAAVKLLDELTPRTSPQLAAGILSALESSSWDGVGQEIVGRLRSMTPALKQIALSQLLKRPNSIMAFLEAVRVGKTSLNDLALDQKQSLASHPNPKVNELANELLKQGGALPSPDRQNVLQQYIASTEKTGDPAKGKAIFKEQCAKCHIYGDMEGVEVGPNLTGMAVHPKRELLTHILDPSRSVEGNFRSYTLMTVDGLVLNGMLASESKTAIELFDTEGKRKSVLRDEIDELVASTKSVMPEGFEKSIDTAAMTDLLEFLTTKGKYTPLPLDKVASAISTKGLFSDGDNGPDRMIFDNWGIKTFKGIPFQLTDPNGGSKANIVLLHGPFGPLPPKMPKTVSLPCNASIKTFHLLSGVGGWSHPYNRDQTVSMIIRFHYTDGEVEDHELKNGIHFADYIRRVDVPESEFAFALGEQQIRYLSVAPKRSLAIESIELVKGSDNTAPIVMAATLESNH